jgi:sugar lactone lactonase YvrE
MVAPSELPDYKPAFAPGSTRADADGNLWIRTSQNVNGIPVYNVVNRSGELIDRVQLPQNRVLVGFGPGGVVYLAVRDGSTAHLEKARVK